ncbi:MAG TPA: hypothetical protein VNP72_11075, partial [Longimicrobium sp.]|nr:hypothetical protein [Longimicrobium sp.]
MKIRFIRIALPLLLAGAVRPAAAQDGRAGNFYVRLRTDAATGEDRSLAIVFADSQPGDGALMWACGADGAGLAAGVRHEYERRSGTVPDVVWRFDHDEPRTTTLHGVKKYEMWVLAPEDAAWLTARARTAARLSLTLPPDSAAPARAANPALPADQEMGRRTPTELVYALAGADSAFDALECGARPPRGHPAPGATLNGAGDTPWLDVDGTLSDAPAEVVPRALNRSEVAGFLSRNYPP